jgi:hypothetical protein
MPRLHLSDDAVGALHQGRQAYVAVAAGAGPHVTPELYAWSGGRLWFASATTTLKTRSLRRRGRAAAVVSAGGRDVLVRGPVESFDLRHPVELARSAPLLPAAGVAWLGYAVRNAPDLIAFGFDALSGRLGPGLPPLRVLHTITPTSAAVLEGGELVARWGRWPGEPSSTRAPRAVRGQPAVAALPGPVVLPGAWDEPGRTFHVAPALADLAGVDGRFPMSVVRDEYFAPGPAAKEGSLLRGEGRTTSSPGALVLDPERLVEWDGVDITAGPA